MFCGGVGLDVGFEFGNLVWEVVGSFWFEGFVGVGVEVMYKNVVNVI